MRMRAGFIILCLITSVALSADALPWAWKWTAAELRQIDQAAKKIQKEGRAEGGFWETKLSNGITIRTVQSPEFTAELAQYLAIFCRVIKDVLPLSLNIEDMSNLSVHVFDSRDQYIIATPEAPEWSRGLFVYGYCDCTGRTCAKTIKPSIHCYTDPKSGLESVRTVIQHELTHAFVYEHFKRFKRQIPIIINEGLAEYMGSWNIRASKPTPQERAARTKRGAHAKYILDQANSKTPPDIMEALAMTAEEFREKREYGLAESFVDFMQEVQLRRILFGTIMKRIETGETVLLTAAELKKIEPQWRTYFIDAAKNLERASLRIK